MNLKTALRLLKWIILIWRFSRMAKQAMNLAKGIGMGVLAGAAVAAIGTKAMGGNRKSRQLKKNAGKAIHTMGNFIGDVERMLK